MRGQSPDLRRALCNRIVMVRNVGALKPHAANGTVKAARDAGRKAALPREPHPLSTMPTLPRVLAGVLLALTTACSPELPLAPTALPTKSTLVVETTEILNPTVKISQELQLIISLNLLTDAELTLLTQPVSLAFAAFEEDRDVVALRHLNTFIDRVELLQARGSLSAFWADVLIARALTAMVLPPAPSDLLREALDRLSQLAQGDDADVAGLVALIDNARRAVDAGRIDGAIRNLHLLGSRVSTMEANGRLTFEEARAFKITLNETFQLLERFYTR